MHSCATSFSIFNTSPIRSSTNLLIESELVNNFVYKNKNTFMRRSNVTQSFSELRGVSESSFDYFSVASVFSMLKRKKIKVSLLCSQGGLSCQLLQRFRYSVAGRRSLFTKRKIYTEFHRRGAPFHEFKRI